MADGDYKGVLLRHTFDSSWYHSPDIILYTNKISQDPKIFINQDWSTDFGSAILLNEYNNIYFRGQNTTGNKTKVRFWFYHTQWGVANWPDQWSDANVLVAGKSVNYIEVDVLGDRVVTPIPLLWKPIEQHCVGAFAENPDPKTGLLSNPPISPKPTNKFNSLSDLGSYILAHPNMAWRNTIPVSNTQTTLQFVDPIVGSASGGNIMIGVMCKDMPTDGFFAFSVPGPDPKSTIVVNKTPIFSPNMAPTVSVQWTPSFNSSIEVSYWQGNTKPPAGASITSIIILPKVNLDFTKSLYNYNSLKKPIKTRLYSSPDMVSSTDIEAYIIGGCSRVFY